MTEPVRPRPRSFVVQWPDGVYALVVGGRVEIVSYVGEKQRECTNGAEEMWSSGAAGTAGVRRNRPAKLGAFS